MVGVSTALALLGGSTPLTVVALRSFGALVILLIYFRMARLPLAMTNRERWIATGIAIPFCINAYSINFAISKIPVPLTILIFYSWPAIVALVSWFARTEVFRWRGFLGLTFAFFGVGLALNVDLNAAQATGVAFALVSAFAWSTVFLLIHRFFPGRDTRPVTLHLAVISAAVFAVACIAMRTFTLPVQMKGWVGVAGVTFFYAFALIGIFTAAVYVGPMRTGFFMNFEPIASVLLSALILGQHLAPVQYCGAALVVLALFLFRPPPRLPDRSS